MYHPRKENPAYDTTEWDEQQQKHGNLEGVELGHDRFKTEVTLENNARMHVHICVCTFVHVAQLLLTLCRSLFTTGTGQT